MDQRNRKLAIVVCLVACIAGCEQVQQTAGSIVQSAQDAIAGKGADDYAEPAVKTLRIAAAATYRERASQRERSLTLSRVSGYGLVPSSPLEDKLNEIADKLILAGPVPDLPTEVRLAASMQFNGYAYPDGLVIIPVGTVEYLQSEDAMAFIVAHEIAHVLLGHQTEDWYVEAQKRAAALLAVSNAAELVGRQLIGQQEKATDASDWQRYIGRTALASEELIAPAFSRAAERDADLVGLDLVVAAGYSPYGSIEALDAMASWERTEGARRSKLFDELATIGRKEALQRISDQLGANTLPEEASGLLDGLAEQATEAGSMAVATFSARHFGAGRRRDDLGLYLDTIYPDLETPDLVEQPWQSLKEQGAAKVILTNYNKASEAAVALAEGRTPEAQADAAAAISGRTDADAMPRVVHASVMSAVNEQSQRRSNLERALRSPEKALKPYLELSDYHEEQGNKAEALAVIQQARQEFGDPPETLPDMIRLNALLGNKAEATRYYTDCTVTYPAYAAACDQAVHGTELEDQGTASGFLNSIKSLFGGSATSS